MRWLLFLFLSLSVTGFAQVRVEPDVLNFATVYTSTPESLMLSVINDSPDMFTVDRAHLWDQEAFHLSQTAFSVAPGDTFELWVRAQPFQNVRHADYLFLESSTHPGPDPVFVFAFARYPEAYYDGTQNLSHEDLKVALRSLLGFGFTTFTYNIARDRVFLELDNKAVNGQGASQNTIACVYTDSLATGYATRSGAQTTFNFNTEHTFPQALFSSNLPMQSDMHHLFAVTAESNTQRSNKPFGVVSSPTWSAGGSKTNSSTFEPRTPHKGVVARALFYFVIRYQDFSNFVAGQQAILRQWCTTYLPDSAEIKRNDAVQQLQGNRNPFIDHPRMIERILNFSSNDPGYQEAWLHHSHDSLHFGVVEVNRSDTAYLGISNQGDVDMELSNVSISGAAFTFDSLPGGSVSIKPDSLYLLPIRFSPTAPMIAYSGQLSFSTNDPGNANVTVNLEGTAGTVSVVDPVKATITVWPNPGNETLNISISDLTGLSSLSLYDLQGRKVLSQPITGSRMELDLAGLAPGQYALQLTGSAGTVVKKLIRR